MVDTCAGARLLACVRVHVCTDPCLHSIWRNEIAPVFLCDFIVFMVCIVSTHPLPPPSEQLDKIHLMVCQEVCFFSFLRLSCRVLSFSINQSCPCTMISRSLSRIETQRGDTGQQLPMSGNRRAATSALVSLTDVVRMLPALHPPLLVALQYFHNLTVIASHRPLRMCAVNMWCGHLFIPKHVLAVKVKVISIS